MKLTQYEKRNYVMNDRNDFVMLKRITSRIKSPEKKGLNAGDKKIVKLIGC